jgi:hypothetical protein
MSAPHSGSKNPGCPLQRIQETPAPNIRAKVYYDFLRMGLIVGNREFFPDHLAKEGREQMLRDI